MNRNEYMAALRRALSVLPEEERANALRYYEEYFDDAGPENEQQVISDLGAPEKVAEQILADYREDLLGDRFGRAEVGNHPLLVFRACVVEIFLVIAQGAGAFLLGQNGERTPQRSHIFIPVHCFHPPKKIESIPLR